MGIIPDPDFDGFDGIFIGRKDRRGQQENDDFDLLSLIRYLRDSKKSFDDLTEEEILQFKNQKETS